MQTVPETRSLATSPGERAIWFAAVLLAAIFLTCLQLTTTEPYRLTSFHRLVNFNAVEPFQHRILLPALVAGLQHYLPLGEKLLFGALEVAGWVALIWLAYRALVLFEVGRTDLIRRVLAFSIVVPVFVHTLPDTHFVTSFVVNDGNLDIGKWLARVQFYYVYDLPATAFVLAMTLVLARYAKAPSNRHMLLYFLLFAIATVNRETSVFMLGLFALLFAKRMPWSRLLVLLALQVALYVAIQWPLNWLFGDNLNPQSKLVGTRYENHILENLKLLTTPLYALTYVTRFAAGLWLPVLLWRRYLDARLIAALAGFGLPLIFFALIAGRVQEQRVFIEIVPLIWLAAMQVIAARLTIADPPSAGESGKAR